MWKSRTKKNLYISSRRLALLSGGKEGRGRPGGGEGDWDGPAAALPLGVPRAARHCQHPSAGLAWHPLNPRPPEANYKVELLLGHLLHCERESVLVLATSLAGGGSVNYYP